MDFFAFFTLFMKMLQDLMEDKNEAQLLKSLRNKGRHEFFAMTKCLRQEEGLRGWKLRKERKAAWGEYMAMEDEELCSMVAECAELRAELATGEVEPPA